MRGLRLSAGLVAALLGLSVLSPAQNIITAVAGSTWVFRGDGGPATNAPLGSTGGAAVDAAGNVFASDWDNCLVVKISASGILTVVAGNRIGGFSGDGGPATAASLNRPHGVALDAAGNLYFADSYNHRIRKVTAAGTITTVAGNGQRGYSGDGGPAVSASLSYPTGVALDAAGNLYIADSGNINTRADSGNLRIRKVTAAGTITTVAGNGQFGYSGDGGPAISASFSYPTGVALDAAGNLYIADAWSLRIRRVTPAGTITTVAGGGSGGDGGPATAAYLGEPMGVALDAAGNLYIAEAFNNRIRKVAPGGTISTVAGNGQQGYSGDGGPAISASFSYPTGVALDAAGNLYIADTMNRRIRKVTLGGTITTLGGNGLFKYAGDGGPAAAASLAAPMGVALDAAGNLYFADNYNRRIRKVTAGGTITTAAGNGQEGYSGDGGPATAASLNKPSGVAVDAAGNLYVADFDNDRIRKVTPGGTITTVAGGGSGGDGGPATAASLYRPGGVALDAAGNLYIAETNHDLIRKVAPGGTISTVAGNGVRGHSGDGGAATAASLMSPWGVAVDAAGNLYIADTANHRVRKVTPGGTITTVAGNGSGGDGGPATAASLNMPWGVAVDAAGNLYIADTGHDRIRKVAPGGTISTVAGNGVRSYSGDGIPATAASLNYPQGVAADAVGNLYIADTGNDRIRKVLATASSFAASPTSLSFSVPGGSPAGASRQIALSSSVAGLNWTAVTSAVSGGNWLSVSPANGQTPATISVSVNASNLAAGTYEGAIYIAAPGASAPSITVSVSLTVSGTQPASLAVQPTSLSFRSAAGGAAPAAQSLSIANAGGGTLTWTAQVSSGSAWLSISPTSGAVSAGPASIVQVSARTSGLTAGNYSGSITISNPATNQTQTIAVSLSVTQASQRLLVSQSGLFFTGVEGGTIVPPQAVGILNVGQGVMGWTIERPTASGGNWLTVSAANGSSDAASLEYPKVDIGVNVTGMRTGLYHGEIVVSAPGADNPRQVLPVDLNVLPPGSNPGLLIRPTGLIFVRQAGTSDPGSQNVNLRTAAPAGFSVRVSPSTFDGGNWLTSAPDTTAVTPGDPREVIVPVKLGNFSPSVYFGTLSVKSQDLAAADSFGSQEVQVLFIVTRGGGTSTASLPGHEADRAAAYGEGPGQNDADGCTPQRLVAVHRTLANNFSAPNGYPSLIEAQVKDDCGQEVTKATVLATFTNGDPVLILTHLSGGTYVGTWVPASKSAVQVTVRATMPPLTEATSKVLGNTGDVRPASTGGGAPFEPQLTRFLNPGFYILEATLAPSAAAGFWGLEVLTSVGQAAGGFNLGGALHPSSSNIPGFGAFMLSTPQTVTANLNAQAPAGTSLTMRFLDSSKKLIGSPVSGPPPLQLGVSLSPGFYIVEVYNGAATAVTYQLGLAADFFSGGVDTGGYLATGIVGFGGFYVPVAQNVTMKLFGQNTYGSSGAGSMVLTLKDSNRQVIQTIGP
jgi:sugar lactone lactonase YvrE